MSLREPLHRRLMLLRDGLHELTKLVLCCEPRELLTKLLAGRVARELFASSSHSCARVTGVPSPFIDRLAMVPLTPLQAADRRNAQSGGRPPRRTEQLWPA